VQRTHGVEAPRAAVGIMRSQWKLFLPIEGAFWRQARGQEGPVDGERATGAWEGGQRASLAQVDELGDRPDIVGG